MSVLLFIYLITLGFCTWFGPRVVAVLDRCDVKAEITTVDAVAGFIIGLIPLVNIFFLFYGGWFLSDIMKVLKEDKAGSKTAISNYNQSLRDLNRNIRG